MQCNITENKDVLGRVYAPSYDRSYIAFLLRSIAAFKFCPGFIHFKRTFMPL